MGDQYTDTAIDIVSRSGSAGGGGPRLPGEGGGGGANRHCCAWEQIKPAIDLICDCLETWGCPNTAQIRQLAQESIMHKNRGE